MEGEILVERRRQWTPEQKAVLLAEVEAEGGRVSVVARRHEMSASLLYNWRSAWKAAAAVRGSASTPAGFIRLGTVADPAGDGSALRLAGGPTFGRGVGSVLAEGTGVIEIDLPEGVRVRVDGGVDDVALRRVLSVVRGLR